MYTSKESLGLEFMKLKMIIAIQVLRLYLSNKRIQLPVAKMISAVEKQLWIENRLNCNPIRIDTKQYWSNLWIDKINNICNERNIIIESELDNKFKIITNKTIMEYAQIYSRQQNKLLQDL